MPCGCFNYNPGGGGGGGSCSGTLTVCKNYHSIIQTSCTNPVVTVEPEYGTVVITGTTGNKKLVYVHDESIPAQTYPQSDTFSYTCGGTTCVITVLINEDLAEDEKIITLTATGTCPVGTPSYTWTIPDCAELVAGYTIYDAIIKVIVKEYDPEIPLEEQTCTFLVDVCCGNCDNCCTCNTITYVPPICVDECDGSGPDCDCDLPCHQYNPSTGICEFLCNPGDVCCGTPGSCAECCTNDDCPGDSICTNGQCKCPNCDNLYVLDPLPNGACPCLEDCLGVCEYCDPLTNTTQSYFPVCGPNEVIDTTTTPCSCKCQLCLVGSDCVPCPCTPPSGGSKVMAWDAQLQDYVEYEGECPECQQCVYNTGNSTWECLPIGCPIPNTVAVSPAITSPDIINPGTGLPCSPEAPCCCIYDPCQQYGDEEISPELIPNNLRIKNEGPCSTSTKFRAWLNNTGQNLTSNVTWEINPTNYTNGWQAVPGSGTTISAGLLTVDTSIVGQGFLVRATYKGRTWQVEYWHDNCGENREIREVFPSCTQVIAYNVLPETPAPTITNNCAGVTVESFPGEIVIHPSDETSEDCLCVNWEFLHPNTGVLCDEYEECFTPQVCEVPCEDAIELLIDKTTDGDGNIVYHGSVLTVPNGNALMYSCETPSYSEWQTASPFWNANNVVASYSPGHQNNCGTLPNSGFSNCGSGSFGCSGNNTGTPQSPCGWVVVGTTVEYVNGANLIVQPAEGAKVCFGVNTICGYVCTCETVEPPVTECNTSISVGHTCSTSPLAFSLAVSMLGDIVTFGGTLQVKVKPTSVSGWQNYQTITVNPGTTLVSPVALSPVPYAYQVIVTPANGCPQVISEGLTECPPDPTPCGQTNVWLNVDCNDPTQLELYIYGPLALNGGTTDFTLLVNNITALTGTLNITGAPDIPQIVTLTVPGVSTPASYQLLLQNTVVNGCSVAPTSSVNIALCSGCSVSGTANLDCDLSELTVTLNSSGSIFVYQITVAGDNAGPMLSNTNVTQQTFVVYPNTAYIYIIIKDNSGNVCNNITLENSCASTPEEKWFCASGSCVSGECIGQGCFDSLVECQASDCFDNGNPCEINIDTECAQLEGNTIVTVVLTGGSIGDEYLITACNQSETVEIEVGQPTVTVVLTCNGIVESPVVTVTRTRGGACSSSITLTDCTEPSELFCENITPVSSTIIDGEPGSSGNRHFYVPQWIDGADPQ